MPFGCAKHRAGTRPRIRPPAQVSRIGRPPGVEPPPPANFGDVLAQAKHPLLAYTLDQSITDDLDLIGARGTT